MQFDQLPKRCFQIFQVSIRREPSSKSQMEVYWFTSECPDAELQTTACNSWRQAANAQSACWLTRRWLGGTRLPVPFPFVKHIVHLAPFNQVYLCAAWHLLLVTSAETITCPMAMYLLCQVGSEKSELEEHVVRRYGPGDGITDCHLFWGCLLHCE